MLTVTKMTVRSWRLDSMGIYWEISPVGGTSDTEQHEIFDYDFYVLRANAAEGPYEKVGGPFRDTYYFMDTLVDLLHSWRTYYYQIQVTNRTTGETAVFGPASSTEPGPDLIAEEIIRLEDLYFREFVGRRCWLFPVRTFGPYCSCYDPVTQRKRRSGHLPCYGTGWLGGYLTPVECWVQFDPNDKADQQSALRETQTNVTKARLIAYPPVSPKDIIVESENKRWRVVSVGTTQRLRKVLHQELTVIEVVKGEIEYALPVEVDLSTMESAAPRNFTNPSNIETVEDYADLYRTFGHPAGTLTK